MLMLMLMVLSSTSRIGFPPRALLVCIVSLMFVVSSTQKASGYFVTGTGQPMEGNRFGRLRVANENQCSYTLTGTQNWF